MLVPLRTVLSLFNLHGPRPSLLIFGETGLGWVNWVFLRHFKSADPKRIHFPWAPSPWISQTWSFDLPAVPSPGLCITLWGKRCHQSSWLVGGHRDSWACPSSTGRDPKREKKGNWSSCFLRWCGDGLSKDSRRPVWRTSHSVAKVKHSIKFRYFLYLGYRDFYFIWLSYLKYGIWYINKKIKYGICCIPLYPRMLLRVIP